MLRRRSRLMRGLQKSVASVTNFSYCLTALTWGLACHARSERFFKIFRSLGFPTIHALPIKQLLMALSFGRDERFKF